MVSVALEKGGRAGRTGARGEGRGRGAAVCDDALYIWIRRWNFASDGWGMLSKGREGRGGRGRKSAERPSPSGRWESC